MLHFMILIDTAPLGRGTSVSGKLKRLQSHYFFPIAEPCTFLVQDVSRQVAPAAPALTAIGAADDHL